MKVCIKGQEFNPSFISMYGEEKARTDGYTIYEVPNGCEDCAFEDFDKNGFNLQKYNARKTREANSQTIEQLKQNLADTDYIANKLAEAIADSLVTGDNTKVYELKTKYAKELQDRKSWRDEIDRLEKN